MQQLKTLFTKLPKISQRGDSGTIYIVFIMAIIIGASYVLVNGLNPEFDDQEAQQTAQQTSTGFDDPNDKLPPLPPTDSPEYQHAKDCADAAKKKAQQFSNKDKPLPINC